MRTKFRRRRLPHYDKPGSIYFVTTCLAGSIPANGLAKLSRFRCQLENQRSPNNQTSRLSTEAWTKTKSKLLFAEMDKWLDRAIAANYLAIPELASEVENAMLYFAPERYSVWAWVVMSNHIHWVFEPSLEWENQLLSSTDRTSRETIMHSLKRHTSRQCNRLLDKTGTFWQDESYDHCIDGVDELQRVINYVELNPVKAGLCNRTEDFTYSSASYRVENDIPVGHPLIGESKLTSFG